MKGLSLKKILVPIDFSDTSMNALNTATSMAKRHGAAIKLLFVHDTYDTFYPQINLFNGHDIIKALCTLSNTVKEDDNVPCSFSYILGDVANCIIGESRAENADLIIIGKNGNSGRKKKSAGSITYKVIRKCTCPVLVVPSGKIWIQFSHILFPVRPVLSMLEKYVIIKEIANKSDATLYVLNLRNPWYINELHIISRLVQLLKIKFKEDNIKTVITYYFKDEKFADKILSVAHDDKLQIDLLIITTEETGILDPFHLSTYTQQIIHESNVPVLIMKPERTVDSRNLVLEELEKQLS